MATMKDVAELAKVSAATVSHVLNGTAKISELTSQKVLRIVEQLNYTPNRMAKSLKLRKSNTIGIITEDITVFNTPEIINGINEYTEEHGFDIILNNIRLYKRIGNNYDEAPKYINIIQEIESVLLSKQVDGIIYVGTHSRDVSGFLGKISKPVVFVYCRSQDPGTVSINYDDELAAYEVTAYLLSIGHRSIALISGRYDSYASQARYRGYQKALAEYGQPFNPELVRSGDWEYESGFRIGGELLDLQAPPTAIFAMNDLMAGGVIDAGEKRGIKIPDQLSLIGFDNRECSSCYKPQLTTVRLPLNLMGQEAAKQLIDALSENRDLQQKEILLNCNLLLRNSVKSV